MSGIIVSVIVPFLESNNKLIDTLSSISEQKNINQENIEVLIVCRKFAENKVIC